MAARMRNTHALSLAVNVPRRRFSNDTNGLPKVITPSGRRTELRPTWPLRMRRQVGHSSSCLSSSICAFLTGS
jgi:hypothetical protein